MNATAAIALPRAVVEAAVDLKRMVWRTTPLAGRPAGLAISLLNAEQAAQRSRCVVYRASAPRLLFSPVAGWHSLRVGLAPEVAVCVLSSRTHMTGRQTVSEEDMGALL